MHSYWVCTCKKNWRPFQQPPHLKMVQGFKKWGRAYLRNLRKIDAIWAGNRWVFCSAPLQLLIGFGCVFPPRFGCMIFGPQKKTWCREPPRSTISPINGSDWGGGAESQSYELPKVREKKMDFRTIFFLQTETMFSWDFCYIPTWECFHKFSE